MSNKSTLDSVDIVYIDLAKLSTENVDVFKRKLGLIEHIKQFTFISSDKHIFPVYNYVLDYHISSVDFFRLTEEQIMAVSKNLIEAENIKSVSIRGCTGSVRMKYLNLYSGLQSLIISDVNDISEIVKLPKLEYISLKGLNLINVSFDSLFSSNSLFKVDIIDCGITTIPEQIFVKNTIRELDVSSNKLTSLPNELCEMRLEILNLSKNCLSEIPECIFNSSTLNYITLFGNNISTKIRHRFKKNITVWIY